MQGWECPRCGQCYGPFVQKCWDCGPRTFTGTGINQTHTCEPTEGTSTIPTCRVCGKVMNLPPPPFITSMSWST